LLIAAQLLGVPAAQAQTFPAACAPGGGLSCTNPLLSPYTYNHPGCDASASTQRATEAEVIQDLQNGAWSSMCNVQPTPQGWATSTVNVQLCLGVSRDEPTYSAIGEELENVRHYQLTWEGTQPFCGSSQSSNETPVIRNRIEFCPFPYTRTSTYCYLQDWMPSPSKMAGPPDVCCGNPINPATGNKYQEEVDYSGRGDFPLTLRRYYNSYPEMMGDLQFDGTGSSGFPYATTYGAAATLQLSFADPKSNAGHAASASNGANWTHFYQRSLFITTPVTASGIDFTTAVIHRHTGRVLTFYLYQNAWRSDSDVNERLVALPNGTYQLTNSADEVELYNASGRLTSITNRAGISHTVAYDACNRVTTVTHSFGQQLAFNYVDPCGTGIPRNRIESVTLPGGGTVSYSYSDLNLSGVQYPDSSSVEYGYGGPAGHALTSKDDESGGTFATWTYDSCGRASGSAHAGGAEEVTIDEPAPCGQLRGWYNYFTDAAGATRRYQYEATINSVKKVTAIAQPNTAGSGLVYSLFAYDANGNQTHKRDYLNNWTCRQFDQARNLETARLEGLNAASDPCPSNVAAYTPTSGTPQRKVVTAWHSTFRLPTSITEANRTTSFTYDSSGNALTRTVTDTSVTPNVSRTWTYTYNAFGRVLTEDGPRTDVSDVTTFTYYTCTLGAQCGQVNTITNALSHVTTFNSYNAHGQATQVTDANGLVTTMAYDARQRITDRCVGSTLPTCAGGELTHLAYWPTGLLKKVTNPDGSYVEYTYDAAHRLTQVNDGAGNKVVYTLDAMGNRTAENTYDPSNTLRRTHSRVFNTLNQLWKDVNAANTSAVTTVFGYDNQGNQTSVAAPLSRNSSSLYDELNRLTQITDPASGITQFGYDANDNLTSVTDPRSLVTSYTYTGFGDLKTQVSPDTGTTTNTYDSGGNLDTSTDSRGAVTTYGYDALNRVTSTAFTIGGTPDPTISYTYDAGTHGKGHLTGASDSHHALAWTYDAQGRVTGKSQTVGGVVLSGGYAYNASGQLSSIALPSGNSIGFGYNSNNQVTSVTLNGSTTILNSISYDPFGPITGWTWGNSTTASRAFDTDGKLTQLDNANGTSLKNFSYDDAFRITGISDAGNSAYDWTYGYDNLDRLTSAAGSAITRGWSYDANGNRLTETGSAPSSFTYMTAPGSNRLASITGSLPRTYGYDAAGNTLSYASATFSYNARGRMASATNSGTTATYVYNALGQRIRRTAAGTSTLYSYDEAGHLQGEYSASGALIQETVWLGDIPVATLRPNGAGGVDLFYVHTDQLNTPRLVTDTANHVRWRWESDPFGTHAPEEDPSGLGVFKYALRFPGQQFDGILGLHYNYFRDYDPAKGGYIQSDPTGLLGGVGTYAYAGNDPLLTLDPTGLLSLTLTVERKDQPSSLGGKKVRGGFTQAFIEFTQCSCECFGGIWVLNECVAKVEVRVRIRTDTYADRIENYRNAEEQHVDDYKKGLGRIRLAGEAAERVVRRMNFASKSECEWYANDAVREAMRSVRNRITDETRDRYDNPGGPHGH
jgi:RHS repeat-associated protein